MVLDKKLTFDSRDKVVTFLSTDPPASLREWRLKFPFLLKNPFTAEVVKLSNIRLCHSTLTGFILVKNIAYNKKLTVRYTVDSWLSFVDLDCRFNVSSCNGFDSFVFELELSLLLKKGYKLDFCLRYQTDDCEFWDNNNEFTPPLPRSKSASSILNPRKIVKIIPQPVTQHIIYPIIVKPHQPTHQQKQYLRHPIVFSDSRKLLVTTPALSESPKIIKTTSLTSETEVIEKEFLPVKKSIKRSLSLDSIKACYDSTNNKAIPNVQKKTLPIYQIHDADLVVVSPPTCSTDSNIQSLFISTNDTSNTRNQFLITNPFLKKLLVESSRNYMNMNDAGHGLVLKKEEQPVFGF